MTATRSGRLSPALLTAAWAAVLVLLTVIAVYLGVRYASFEDGPSRIGGDRDSWVSDAERSEALQVAEQFALRMDAINGADPKAYADKVKELLTTKGKSAFEEQFAALQQLGTDKQTRGTGEVLATALADIDHDSASALVVHDAVVTSPQGSNGRHYRWTVALEKVKGEWLVDSFQQVG